MLVLLRADVAERNRSILLPLRLLLAGIVLDAVSDLLEAVESEDVLVSSSDEDELPSSALCWRVRECFRTSPWPPSPVKVRPRRRDFLSPRLRWRFPPGEAELFAYTLM
mmetsp:Transcript_11182/g.35691  ORF Transcript_11182/g.35691 Transcript_11182/m.35691 type:complete len:109 (-) Transcript_11182:261-587(-)